VNGDLVPPADAKALAAAIVRLLKDRETWDRYNTAGPESVTRNLSWEGMGRAVAQAYSDVLGADIESRQEAI
jgi:glycosyltransferase involved in cell wall biosynthesis